MSKSKMESRCAEWLAKRFDPEDKEQLSAFREWLERGAQDPGRCVTVHEVVVEAWQRLIEQKKVH